MLNIWHKEVPREVPAPFKEYVQRMRQMKSREVVIKESVRLVNKHLVARRAATYFRFPLIFRTDIEKMWSKGGFVHCNILNYYVRCFLVWSDHFRNENIKNYWTAVWFFSPHQYLVVRGLGKKKRFDLDPWAYQFGVPLGKHAWGFNQCVRNINE